MNVVKTNHIFYQTKRLSLIQFGSLKLFVLTKHGLSRVATQEGFFSISVFERLVINMTLFSEVEEEIGEENGKQENSSTEINKALAALKAIPVRLHWGQIFSPLMRHVNMWP